MDKNRIIMYALTAALIGILAYVFIPWQSTKQEKPELVTASDTLYKRVIYVDKISGLTSYRDTIKVDDNAKIIRTGQANKKTAQYTEITSVVVTLSDGKVLDKADIISVLDKK